MRWRILVFKMDFSHPNWKIRRISKPQIIDDAALFGFDVVSSASLGTEGNLAIRRNTYPSFIRSVRRLGWLAAKAWLDEGDGMIVVLSPKISIQQIIDTTVPRFLAGIINAETKHPITQASPLGLRLALHRGTVHKDSFGCSYPGNGIGELFRILNAQALRDFQAEQDSQAIAPAKQNLPKTSS
jgi:hypothetical protein